MSGRTNQIDHLSPAMRIRSIVDAAIPPVAPLAEDFVSPADSLTSPAKPRRQRGAGRRETAKRAGATDTASRPVEVQSEQRLLDRRLAFFPQTDLGNAERFRERFRGKLIWCAAIGWLWWDAKRWSRTGADEQVR